MANGLAPAPFQYTSGDGFRGWLLSLRRARNAPVSKGAPRLRASRRVLRALLSMREEEGGLGQVVARERHGAVEPIGLARGLGPARGAVALDARLRGKAELGDDPLRGRVV